MASGGHVPHAIVLALGAAALGGPEALQILLQFAGRSGPAVDLTICFVVITLLTVPLLGTVLLTRFVRKPAPARAGGGRGRRAPTTATDLFAHVTAAVSVGAALLVTACLIAVPAGQIGAVRGLAIEFAVVNPVVVTILVVCAAAAAAATGSLPCAAHLRARFFRRAGTGSGVDGAPAAPAAAPAPATTARIDKAAVSFVVVTTSLVGVASLAASRAGFDAAQAQLLLSPEYPIGVAAVTVAGATTLLVVRCYSRKGRARNAAGARGRAAAAWTS